MPLLILGLILGIPILELMVMIEIGGNIGAFSTVMLTILTAIVGLQLVRQQGFKVISEMQVAAQAGEPVGGKLIHGGFLAVAGLFLFFPGFITDFIGALFLIPPVRQLLGVFIVSRLARRAKAASYTQHSADAETTNTRTTIVYGVLEEDEKTVEAEHWEETKASPPKDTDPS